MDEHAKQEKASPEIQEETEFRLRSRSIPLPLSWEEVHVFSDFFHEKEGRLSYKKFTEEEKEWAEFLLQKAIDYAQRKQEWYEGLEQLQDEHPDDIALRAVLYSAREQITSAVFLAERARTALYVQKFLGGGEAPEELQKRYAETEAALASQKAENDRLRARVAELEKAALEGAEGGKKGIDPRERKTFLKLLNAALFMDKQKDIEDRTLAGKLARKTYELFGESSVAEKTVRNKLNEIRKLEE